MYHLIRIMEGLIAISVQLGSCLRKKEYLTKLNGNMVKLKIRVLQLFPCKTITF